MAEAQKSTVPFEHLRVARVIHEDAQEITVTIQKDQDRPIHLEDGDKFYTFLFLKTDPEGGASSWLPWAESEGGTIPDGEVGT